MHVALLLQVALGQPGLGLVAWGSVAVHHCSDAYGVVLQHADGWKLVYSGEGRPADACVKDGGGEGRACGPCIPSSNVCARL